MDDPKTKWRFGEAPNYDLANLLFLKVGARSLPPSSTARQAVHAERGASLSFRLPLGSLSLASSRLSPSLPPSCL
eukprot:3544578-Rhodomonas_salina.1